MAAQDDTVSLSAVEMSSAATAEERTSPFANLSAVLNDHSCLPTRFGVLDESHHLLALNDNGGLVIPSEGRATPMRAAELQSPNLSTLSGRRSEGTFFCLGNTLRRQFGTDDHHSNLSSLVVSVSTAVS